MPEAMEIKITLEGVREVVAGGNKLADTIRDLGKADQDLGRAARGGSGVGARSRMSDDERAERQRRQSDHMSAMQALRAEARAQQTLARQTRIEQGPSQRLSAARFNLMTAEAIGNPGQLLDAQIRVQQAQRNLNLAARRLNDPGHTTAPGLLDLMGDIRRGNVGGIAASLGRGVAAKAAGGTAEEAASAAGLAGLGSVALPALGAAAALAAVVVAGKVAAEQLAAAARAAAEFGNAAMISGGTGANIAGLRSMGIPAGSIAGIAAGLRGRLGSDPFAMMAGGFVAPRPFGPTNEAGILESRIAMLQATRQLKGEEAELRQARMLQMDGLLELINVSRQEIGLRRQEAGISRGVFDAHTTQAARDLAAELETNKNLWEDLRGEMMRVPIDETLDFFRRFNQGLANIVGGNQGLFEGLGAGIAHGIWMGLRSVPGLGFLLDAAAAIADSGGKANALPKALDRNTQSNDDLSRVMRDVGNGRTRLPSANAAGWMHDNAAFAQGGLGAFSD